MKPLSGGPLITIALLSVLILFVAGVSYSPVMAQTPEPPGSEVYIYFFWGDGCPHCAKAKPFLESLAAKYPEVDLQEYEVYYDPVGQKAFMNIAQKYGLENLYVPTMFVGQYYLQGYSEEYDPDIEAVIVHCIQEGCEDAGVGVEGLPQHLTPTSVPTSAPTPTVAVQATEVPQATEAPQAATPIPGGSTDGQSLNQDMTLNVPLLGNVNLGRQSVILSTALIAFVDGFNPCSMWVLGMLLALTLHTGSRKKVFTIGLIFITVTAAIYALFIAGLFNVLKIAGFLGWIQVVVAIIALFFGLVNVKDYFWFKEGLSFTIADDKKAGIFKRMRAVVNASQSFWGMAGATVVLAAGVSMVEFSCTAGFPVLWVNLLTSQAVGGAAFVLLLLLYMIIYQIDELAIFASAVISLRASRLEEKHGRILKLAGGMLMLALSMVMLIDPALMNSLSSSLIIFAAAFAATLLVLLIHRVLMPKMGIQTQ